ncbi:MAG TPA: ABC transporter ATP-binding protein [Acholeplasmataceae bacterium]|jgi:ABC-2 type transport system ATP-binding protein|nr:ABC transporter ATP-binding protein [Acholeplasmataceae bacterium]
MEALKITNLCKEFKDFKLDNLNLTLPSGCIIGLIGENGAGKSTTIKLILDMIKKDSGNIMIFGKNNQEFLKLNKEDIGVVLDEIGISGCLTAKEIGKIMKYSFNKWEDETFNNYLSKLNIPMDKMFKDFSRGMKMKLQIAIALSHQAKLLILDEPTSGLDPVIRDEVINIFNEFTRDENHSILISSHIVSDLEKLCDYIAFLHKGKLLLFEEKDVLFEKYGIIHVTPYELRQINKKAIIGKKESVYGTELIVKRDSIPSGFEINPISIEELFVFMAKENI